MDTKALVVGQDIWMRSGEYAKRGKVVAISVPGAKEIMASNGPPMPEGGCVEVEFSYADGRRYFIRFDANGKTGTGWEGFGQWDYIGPEIGPLQSDPRLPGTEFGPWELVESPQIPA